MLQGFFSKMTGRTGIVKYQPSDSKWTIQIGSGDEAGGASAGIGSTALPAAVPWPEWPISSYEA
jgi:hypothetical protein